MIHFKHFTSLQWFGFILILSFVLMILSLFTNEPAPFFFIFVNGLGALLAFLLIGWPSKDGYPVPMPGVILNDANARDFKFNPVGGKSAEEILWWFQQIAEVELNAHNYTLSLNAIKVHLMNNSDPSVKSVLDELETFEPLRSFSLELKKKLLHPSSAANQQ